MDEFDLIEKYFKPLSRNCGGALQLADDAAVIGVTPGQEMIVTTDAMSAGVHFVGNEEAGLIARKLLRVNLSDLAAMGAKPLVYFLTLMLPPEVSEEWVKQFAQGLAEDQLQFTIQLAGGDTVATQGPLCCSITALGTAPTGTSLRRGKALPGDIVYVTGTIGDSALGLMSLQANPGARAPSFLEQRYLLPQPRVALGQKLRGIATAAMDVSDGLAQDLGHICQASGVSATIRAHSVPLSPDAAARLEADPALRNTILSGGDDYELLFTAPPEHLSGLNALSAELDVRITPIGFIAEGSGVTILDPAGSPIALERKGFRHFG